ncbi:hypothetical protein GGX14DRAFT_410216 [Mycena pura]|uniref:Uncharacterized protein n=1 Tax=Mycena pura TaxID=153505 RepID=A0AAD6YUW1_9AGAR|nr:hypothetical protein GGX14DRAFT_410216 [Mycena pura]
MSMSNPRQGSARCILSSPCHCQWRRHYSLRLGDLSSRFFFVCSGALLCVYLLQGSFPPHQTRIGLAGLAELPHTVAMHADALHPYASLNGPPIITPSYQENLRDSTKYVTSWGGEAGWTNDVIAIMNLVYLGLITDRVPILPHHTSIHLDNAPRLPFSDVFDLPRLRRALDKPILDSIPDDLGCWSVWSSVQGDEKKPRWSPVPTKLNIDISYTQAPPWIKLFPGLKYDMHCTFWSLAALVLSRTQPLPSPQRHLSLPPFECESDYSPVWRDVGQHMRWTASLESLADQYIRQALGAKAKNSIPPFISVHARHSDFTIYCPRANPRCFAPLSAIAKQVEERNRIRVDHVFVTSDERNQMWWDQVAQMGWRTADHGRLKTEEAHGVW